MSKADKEIKQLIKEVEKARDQLLDEIEDIGNEAADIIRKRTQLGYGVSEHGANKKKLNKLTAKYVKRRQRLSLGEKTTARRSNLTLSGQMLNDLEAQKKSDNSVEITFKTEDSKDKAKWNADKERPFNFLSKSEIRQVKEIIQKKIQKLLKK